MFWQKNILFVFIVLILSACQTTTERAIGVNGAQFDIRDLKTRKFSNVSKNQALRATVAALQDLSFTIDNADIKLGLITATKLSHDIITVTVVVQSKEQGVVVSVNARQAGHIISDPEVYLNYYAVFNLSLFLFPKK